MPKSRYSEPELRAKKTPPHVSLRTLRRVSGKSLEQVCEAVNEIMNAPAGKGLNRGSLSAIETGLRGPSDRLLRALALAYGLDEDEIRTDFVPRARAASVDDAAELKASA